MEQLDAMLRCQPMSCAHAKKKLSNDRGVRMTLRPSPLQARCVTPCGDCTSNIICATISTAYNHGMWRRRRGIIDCPFEITPPTTQSSYSRSESALRTYTPIYTKVAKPLVKEAPPCLLIVVGNWSIAFRASLSVQSSSSCATRRGHTCDILFATFLVRDWQHGPIYRTVTG
jgi:hypothetical protein